MIRALLGLVKNVGKDGKMETTDPYEQQLLAVFQSCDDYYQNSLSSDGLYQLCEKLQLEDHYHKLLKCVLGESEKRRVTFFEFKDGLLKLLNNSEFEDGSDRAISPAREISPKSVFGKKKYGRRSRPESIENDNHMVDDADDTHHAIHSCSTDNDSGSEESVPKKRKTRSFKRKDNTDAEAKVRQSILSPVSCTLNEEECLISAWSSVSGGIANSLKRDELVNVFQCVGLESGSDEAAQRVFEKLEVEEDGTITLQELLQFIRSGADWSKEMRNQEVDTETCQKSANFDYVDSSAVGSVTGAYLVEQWEAAGVPGASHFLHKLGLSETQQIDVASLIALLSDELKLINDDKSRSSLDPSTAILSAISVLQNIHVQSLKSLIEHMNAEKDKLRNDVIEANQRALLLAQEIDDHHSKLEHSAQQQVKTLEQRHTEKIRELTLQLKSEQDAQATHTSQLEKKVSTLEEERNKCKSVIMQLELENKTLEHEHRVVTDQLANLQRIKEKLEADLEALSNLQMRATEMQAKVNNSEIMSLLERINVLESENTNLRDRNDELSTEVEELSTKLHNACIKKRSSPVNSSSFCADESMDEGAFPGGGTKRRGDSFGGMDSAEDSGDDEGSPRLGKVRKCSPVKDYASAANCLEGSGREDATERGRGEDEDSGGAV
ncbi:UNVERIFIED_CONTAM: hypothetical protein PYX00_009823 [Menopon gallinae]|uniref:EF-hand domain-containing protein n=1 Tax=Menopon gallinae TaxID=328185 RepID=A0AAW2HD06_9NEOP